MTADTIDISNYTPVESLTPSVIANLKAYGITTVAIGASYGTLVDEQAALLKDHFDLEFYGFPDTQSTLATALNACLRWPCKRFWVDLEGPGIPLEQAINLADAVCYPRGIEDVIYTNMASWGQHGAGTNTYGKRLIYAHYDENPAIDWPREGFGGWTLDQVLRKQYSYRGIFGINCDLSITNQEATMTVDEVNQLIEAKINAEVYPKIGALLANAGRTGAALTAIGDAFFDHVANHPGGGATATMAAAIAGASDKIAAIEAATASLDAALKKLNAKTTP